MKHEFEVGDRVQFAADPPGVNPPPLIDKPGVVTIVTGHGLECRYSVRLDAGHIIAGVEPIQLMLAD